MVHLRLFDTRFPLIQAPMAGVQDARLALAAAAAGALGSLPAAMLDDAALDAALAKLDASGLPYNVNFFCHTPPPADASVEARWRERLAPYYQELGLASDDVSTAGGRRPFGEETAAIVGRHRPAVISFHFGLPAPALLARAKATGARILSSATTVDEARWLQQHGADGVIAQGLEAGGHRGHFLSTDIALQSGTMPLLRAIRDAIDLPVIAAGGIADAVTVRAAMEVGACAVQVGTAFMLCPEATTGPLHRARLKDSQAPTELTNLFSGGLARGFINRLMRDFGPVSALAPAFPLASQALAPLRSRAEALGRDDFSPLWSGTQRGGCREVPAAEIVRALVAGFTAESATES